jgi:hypothetical protein
MAIRKQATQTWGGVTAKDILSAPESSDGDPAKIIEINGQNYRATPHTHKDDSVRDEDLVMCDWADATYICLDGQYQKSYTWLSCGNDKYS